MKCHVCNYNHARIEEGWGFYCPQCSRNEKAKALESEARNLRSSHVALSTCPRCNAQVEGFGGHTCKATESEANTGPGSGLAETMHPHSLAIACLERVRERIAAEMPELIRYECSPRHVTDRYLRIIDEEISKCTPK